MEEKEMTQQEINQAASDAFMQAEQGLEVPLDPDLADAMGAFEENALSLEDILDDLASREEEDGKGR